MKLQGQKRDDLIATGKAGHNILLFGNKLVGGLSKADLNHESATIHVIPFPTNYELLERLSTYSLVILDYAAFQDGVSVRSEPQDIFEKQMLDALDAGTTFCFVHYKEIVPGPDKYGHETGYMAKSEIAKCRDFQIGFRWLFNIRPRVSKDLLLSTDIARNEFKSFLDKWGASYNGFTTYGDGKIDEVICSFGKFVVGFVLNFRKGRIVYLPFQRDYTRKKDLAHGLQSLIDCLITYTVKSTSDIPLWGTSPFFQEESLIRKECDELEQKLENAFSRLRPFDAAKNLLFQSEYILESSIPRFISGYMGLKVLRDEKYKEDFWILNDAGDKNIIVEVKSMVKGFKKSAIFSLYNHREESKLNEAFPGLLIANCNLQAGTWADKDRKIDKQDYEVSAQNNILILRVEDLVRLWDAVRLKKLEAKDVLSLLLSKKGWLYVNENHDVKEFK